VRGGEPWELLQRRAPALRTGELERYAREIERWNRSIRLVGPKELPGVRLQIADALLPFLLVPPAFPLLDLGSGAGLPGLPLAMAYPGEPVVCMEPNAKKTSFLRHAVRLLGLRTVRVVQARAEDAVSQAPELERAFRTVTARAVAETEKLLAMAERFLAPSGRVFLPRGEEEGRELAAWKLVEDRPYAEPAGVGPRRLLVYERR
jgi:16S rRNA (guanine527-N7)-methyltransferase